MDSREIRKNTKQNEKTNKEVTPFALTAEEREQLDRIYRTLLEFCQIHSLPMIASVAVKNDEEGTEYMSNIYTAQSHRRVLKKDIIRKHLLISNGFDAVPPRENFTVTLPTYIDDADAENTEQEIVEVEDGTDVLQPTETADEEA